MRRVRSVSTRTTSQTSETLSHTLRNPVGDPVYRPDRSSSKVKQEARLYFKMMDYFTKFVEGVPVRNQEAATLAQVIVEKICAVFGTTLRLLSDRGSAFESGVFAEMCKLLSIEKVRTTAYEPRTNVLIERYHRTMNQMIGKMVAENHRNWHEILPIVAAAYRASVHESTGYSPNYLIFGRENLMTVDVVYGPPPSHEYRDVTDYAMELRSTLRYAYELVRRELGVAANRRKRVYDMGVHVKEFLVGDRVWVFIPRRRRNHYPKWERFFQGPFEITQKTGPLNYRVQKLPRGRSFVVHADKLVRCSDRTETESEVDRDCGRNDEVVSGLSSVASNPYSLRNVAPPEAEKEGYRRLRPRERIHRPTRFLTD